MPGIVTSGIVMSGIVRTVAGDVSSADLGVVDSHDHLFLSTPARPGEELADPDSATREAGRFRAAGGRTIVQWTPRGLGRRLADLAAVSATTGVHVIAATGRHRREVYGHGHPMLDAHEGRLADAFIADVEDRRCGVIKVGTGPDGPTAFELTSLAAAAAAHHATGTPIAVHLEGGRGALDVVDVLGSLDVSPQAIILGHLGRNADLGCVTDAVATGAFICIDGPSPGHARTDAAVMPVLGRVLEAGGAGSLLIGGDTTTRAATAGHGGRGMSGLLTRTRPTITRNFGDAIAHAAFTTNPARAFQVR